MKTKLSFSALLSFIFCLLSFSQVPQGINYQAIASDNGGLIEEKLINIRLSILSDSTGFKPGGGGTYLWEEQFLNVRTDKNGSFSLPLGTGSKVQGSVAAFNLINWSNGPHFIGVKLAYPTTGPYKPMGSAKLWSVPYAMVADNITGPVKKLSVSGTATDYGEALFEVRNKDGMVVFAVYSEGVRILIDNGEPGKGTKGGFAIGGFDKAKGTEQDLFVVTNDSIRAYIDSTGAKASRKGGFAIGSFNRAKAGREEYLRVTRDSTRIYIDDAVTKRTKGGFAIGGFDRAKAPLKNYLRVTNDSTRIYVTDKTKTGSLGGFAVKPVTSGNQGIDFFNISSAVTAEVVKNESRVMWYPAKSALLGGEVRVGSPDSVGKNSTALGYRSVAKGNQSQAFGFQSMAYGTYSTAIGYKAVSDTNSMAVGYLARATGNDAFALGSGAIAQADKSFAFGSTGIDSLGNVTGNTKALGEYAYAFGLGSVASGRGAFALGANDTASFDFATAIGYKTKANNWYALAMGSYSVASGKYATAIGYRNKATADGSTALGRYSEATGTNSFASGYQSKATQANASALGYRSQANSAGAFAAGYQATASQTASAALGRLTTASGIYSLAFGYNTVASGSYSAVGGLGGDAISSYSFAFGRDVLASGDYAVSFGYMPRAQAYCSYATGFNTRSTGQFSFSAGYESKSKSYNSFVVGRWNDSTGTTSAWVATEPLFIVGNGGAATSTNNAFTVYKNGNTKVDGIFYPQRDNTFTLGSSSNRWSVVYAGNGTINTSDERQKAEIRDISYGLKEIMNLHPVSFRWKSEPERGVFLGLVAQEVMPLIPHAVDIGNDPAMTLGINYSSLIPVLIRSIQEQQKIIETQKQKNSDLELRMAELVKRIELLENNIK